MTYRRQNRCFHAYLPLLKVVDHYENPRNVGSLDKNKKNVGTGLVGAPACGDVMKLQVSWSCTAPLSGLTSYWYIPKGLPLVLLQIQVDENGRIADAKIH
ncbi:hypothetical protein XENOCAPTIV_012650 [Xenoophorus captivus]|uniref:NIF system FeS cluster assembly NifU N-terminal domain-containing protein n=1 Tax=Xenoophorus captivus TaxID=1517983 RepID=A0ABV0R3J1_9TELE